MSLNHIKSGQTRKGEAKSGQIRPEQTKSSQIRPGQVKSGQLGSEKVRSHQIKSENCDVGFSGRVISGSGAGTRGPSNWSKIRGETDRQTER